jgi:hypothetical protein
MMLAWLRAHSVLTELPYDAGLSQVISAHALLNYFAYDGFRLVAERRSLSKSPLQVKHNIYFLGTNEAVSE